MIGAVGIFILVGLVFARWYVMSYTLPPGYTLTYREGALYGFWVLRDPDHRVLGDEIIALEILPGGVARNLTRRANAHVKRGGN